MALAEAIRRMFPKTPPRARAYVAPRALQDFNNFFVTDLTPERAKRTLRAAASGEPYEQAILFDEMLETDGDLDNCYRTRLLALTAMAWEVIPVNQAGYRNQRELSAAEERLAGEAADYCLEVLDGIDRFDDLLKHLADAIGRGIAVGQLVWDTIDGSRRPVMAAPVMHTQLRCELMDPARLRIVSDEEPWKGQPIDEFPAGQLIIHQPRSLGGSFFRGGLHRAAVVPHMFKRMGRKSWVFGIEAFGLPMSIAKYDAIDPETKTQILKMLGDLGVGRGGLFPKGCEFEFVEYNQHGQWPHERLMAYCDAGYSKLYLGQTLTTQVGETGGAYAAAAVHNEVRKDIRDDDIHAEASTLRDQLLRPLVLYKFGEAAARLVPVFRRVVEEARDDAADMNILDSAVNRLGYRVPKRYVAERFALPAVDNENLEEALPGQSAGTSPFGDFASQLTANKAGALSSPSLRLQAHRALETIRGRKGSIARLVPWILTAVLASQAHTENVVAAIGAALARREQGTGTEGDQGGSPKEEIADSLGEIVAELPVDDMTELVRQVLVAGELAGRAHSLTRVLEAGARREARPGKLLEPQIAQMLTENGIRSLRPSAKSAVSVLAMAERIDFERLPFIEAIESLRDRIGLNPEEFIALDREARSRAFRVAGVWNMDLLAAVHTNLLLSIKNGETARDFRLRVLPEMADREGWTGENPWHADVVFYQNFAMSHAAGRQRQYEEFEIPAWRFVATGDSCPICEPQVNHIFRVGDTARMPPLHFWCDCESEPVFEDEVDKAGALSSSAELKNTALEAEHERPSGFKWDVRQYGNLEPINLSKYSPDLREAFHRFALAGRLPIADTPERDQSVRSPSAGEREWLDSLGAEGRAALHNYTTTGAGFRDVIGLQKNPGIAAEMSAEQLAAAKTILNWLERAWATRPKDVPQTLHRGIANLSPDEAVKQAQSDELGWDSWTSASRLESVAARYGRYALMDEGREWIEFEIRAKSGMPMERVAAKKQQAEILQRHGTILRVLEAARILEPRPGWKLIVEEV